MAVRSRQHCLVATQLLLDNGAEIVDLPEMASDSEDSFSLL